MSKLIYRPTKFYSEDINDLIVDSELFKGRALPIGTVRNWSGKSWVKEADGWKPIADQKNEKPVEEIKSTQSKNVTDEERAALKEYQSGVYNSAIGGYANIQAYLRNGKPKFGTFTAKEKAIADEVVKNVSSAIQKHKLDKPMTVYRGVKVNKDEPGSKIYADLKVGDIFSDKGFTSTTTSKTVQGKFSEKLNRSDIPVSIEISLKPGDAALPMDRYHKSNEKEVLLDRNTKFKVLSVHDGKNGRKIKLEIV
jgi:hypothetical protein